MRKSLRNIHLILAFGGKQHAGPFSEGRRANSHVHRNIQHFAFHHAAEFRLRMRQLVMEAAQRPFRGMRVVVLDKNVSNADVGEPLRVVSLQKKPPRVAEYFRLEFPDLR